MKKSLCCLLVTVLLLSLFTGCACGTGGEEPPPTSSESKPAGLSEFMTGSDSADFVLTENEELDMTGIQMLCSKTVALQGEITLKLTGSFTPVKDCSVCIVPADGESVGKAVIDLSGLTFELSDTGRTTIFEIRNDVQLTAPPAQERMFIDTSGDQWISIKALLPNEEVRPDDPPPEDVDPDSVFEASTQEEFLRAFGNSEAARIELKNDISVRFEAASLTNDMSISCNGHALTLSGNLNLHGGALSIADSSESESAKVDLSGLTVTCDIRDHTRSLVSIGINPRNIIGEPALGENLLYEISDSGDHASIRQEEVITPEQHEAKLKEEMTQYLSGVVFHGGVGISAEFLADGVLEINLDNPVIEKEIGVGIDGGMKLIITGSVTFNGGHYAFGRNDGSTGTVTVDITGLEIHGTDALGRSKSPDIFKITLKNVDFKYNENAPHIKAVTNDHFWLQYWN